MATQQYISLGTILLILSAAHVDVASASAVNPPQPYAIAQSSDDEMLDALQERQKKIDGGLEKIRKLTGDESKDLGKNQATLDALQAENFNVESLDELNTVKTIISDQNLSQAEMLDALQANNFNIDNLEQLQKLTQIAGQKNSAHTPQETGMSAQMAFTLLAVGLPATILVFFLGKPMAQGLVEVLVSNYQDKFGKPKVPERPLNLHNNALKELENLGKRIEKLSDDKFTSDEFKLLLNIKVSVIKGDEEYKELGYKAELLRAAILAQKSFLKLEATELRYRSRKQQQFYQYVADNLEEDLDKQAFAKKIKSKQSEILPLVNTDEGRNAINSYAQEIEALSKHELGLKLLTLFKKLELKDFSIIRDVSDVVEGLAKHDLMNAKSLIMVVKEYCDVFHKISPILSISSDEQSNATYARILQIVALMHRHGDAYIKFKELVNLLRKWEKPFETVKMIREEYNRQEYTLPSEFTTDIIGESVYQKHVEYLPDL
ncbi:MAG: hypothetical protein AAFQ41_02975 [Cyanobacteria bacterium J06623_7]